VLVALVVVAGGGSLQAGASDPVPPVSIAPTATAAAGWLASELTAGNGELSNGGMADWGLTADAAIALVGVNGPTDPAAGAAVANLLANIGAYTTFDDAVPPRLGVKLAGPTAKSLLVAELAGQAGDPVAVMLETGLRSLLESSGRFIDANPYGPDASNGFGQADAILALARTGGGVPAGAVNFLLAQQCPNGGFPLLYSGTTCTDNTRVDTDATAVAVQALLSLTRTSGIGSALSQAVGLLESIQDPTTGSFSGTGFTAAPNANSTGLIAEALRGAGATAEADRAAEWVTSLQLAAPSVSAGAIAYNPDGFAAAASGIPVLSIDQWHRSTSQAVLAAGVAPLGSIGAGGAPLPDPVTPVTPTSTSSTTTTTAQQGTSTTTTTAGTTSTTNGSTSGVSTSTSTSTSNPVAVKAASVQRVNFATALGSSSRSGSSSSARLTSTNALAHTGSTIEPFIAVGLMAFFLGLAAVFAVRFGDWTA